MGLRRILILVGVLGLALLVGLAVLRPGRTAPATFNDPPIFPGAVERTQVEEKLPGGTHFPQHVSFRAAAAPAEILAFYRAALQRDG